MTLHVLPTRTAGAAENMATDFLLLQRYPTTPGAPRFRHYDWRGPAVTFGYAQKISFVREKLAAAIAESDGRLELCRRATGGGVVDHRDDWTYALVLPRGHPLEETRASQSYRLVHEALAAALRDQGVPAVTKLAPENPTPEAGAAPRADVCFDRAEVYDVIYETSGAKIAGAAQKRNKNGLLLQGSIWRPAAGAAVEWDAFGENFLSRLAEALGGPAEPVPWPEFHEDEVSALIDQYASSEWNEFR